MPSNEVLVELKDRVATITLNRPDVLNAVHREMFEVIRAAALDLDDDPDVGAIILTGAGRGFCSGVDVSGHDFGSSVDRTPTIYAYEGGPAAIYNIRKPTIAAVGGPAVGVGMGMALACDIRIASEDARFTTGLARVGLPAVDGLGWTLPRLVGEAKALELIYTADMIGAEEAERIGLVSYVTPRGELAERAFDLGASLRRRPALRLLPLEVPRAQRRKPRLRALPPPRIRRLAQQPLLRRPRHHRSRPSPQGKAQARLPRHAPHPEKRHHATRPRRAYALNETLCSFRPAALLS